MRSGATAVNRIIEVDLAMSGSPGVLLAGVTKVAFPADECLAMPADDLAKATNVTISLAGGLPALEPQAVNVTASLPAANGAPAESASDGTTVSAAPQPILTVAADTTVRRVGPEPITIRLSAVSLGNVGVRGKMTVQPTPPNANLTNPGMVAVADIELARAGQPGDTGSANLTFTPPSGPWTNQVVVVTVTAFSTDASATRGATVNMTFLFQNDVTEKGSPGPLAPLGLLAVAGVAHARRRRC